MVCWMAFKNMFPLGVLISVSIEDTLQIDVPKMVPTMWVIYTHPQTQLQCNLVGVPFEL